MIARLPKLRYLDERPVTEEDRRRAHAFAEGKLPAERIEIKVIKEDKEEKRKVDLEELNDFVQLRTEEKKEEQQKKEETKSLMKKLTMKDMLARAREEKRKAEEKSLAPEGQ